MELKEELFRQVGRIGQKTSAFIGESRLRTANSILEADIKGLYRTAGEAAYSLWKKGGRDWSRLNEYFVEIKKKEEQILENERQISRIQNSGAGVSAEAPEKAGMQEKTPGLEGAEASGEGLRTEAKSEAPGKAASIPEPDILQEDPDRASEPEEISIFQAGYPC